MNALALFVMEDAERNGDVPFWIRGILTKPTGSALAGMKDNEEPVLGFSSVGLRHYVHPAVTSGSRSPASTQEEAQRCTPYLCAYVEGYRRGKLGRERTQRSSRTHSYGPRVFIQAAGSRYADSLSVTPVSARPAGLERSSRREVCISLATRSITYISCVGDKNYLRERGRGSQKNE